LHCPTRIRFLLSTMPHPPRSTLFPYTTLFRSRDAEGEQLPLDPHRRHRPGGQDRRGADPHPRDAPAGRARRRGTLALQGGVARRDRKSTRLNSSHVKISYAVFCLKKNKTASQK